MMQSLHMRSRAPNGEGKFAYELRYTLFFIVKNGWHMERLMGKGAELKAAKGDLWHENQFRMRSGKTCALQRIISQTENAFQSFLLCGSF